MDSARAQLLRFFLAQRQSVSIAGLSRGHVPEDPAFGDHGAQLHQVMVHGYGFHSALRGPIPNHNFE
jgi:hypothetical protein